MIAVTAVMPAKYTQTYYMVVYLAVKVTNYKKVCQTCLLPRL